MLELGVGFVVLSSQVHLEAARQDDYIDLLFSHVKLRCSVVIDLKVRIFKPGNVGKMNFSLNVGDNQVRHGRNAPTTIGLIMGRIQDSVTAGVDKPPGIARSPRAERLPVDLREQLPSIQALEAELATLFDCSHCGHHGSRDGNAAQVLRNRFSHGVPYRRQSLRYDC